MYIILGEEQIALTLWYWRGVKTLSDVSDYNCGYSSKDTWWPDAF